MCKYTATPTTAITSVTSLNLRQLHFAETPTLHIVKPCSNMTLTCLCPTSGEDVNPQ